jgi:hypothetical protein
MQTLYVCQWSPKQLMLLVILAVLSEVKGTIWDFQYSCEPAGEVSTVTFQSPYKEPTNFTLIVNWGPYTEELKRTLRESESLSVNFKYQQETAGENSRNYYNRSFEFRSAGLVRSITHQKCIMYDGGILQGNCCRPSPRFHIPIEWPRRIVDRYRNRKTRKSWPMEVRSVDGGCHRRGYADPLAIAVAVVWAALHHKLGRQ